MAASKNSNTEPGLQEVNLKSSVVSSTDFDRMWSRAAIEKFTELLVHADRLITQTFARFGSCQLVDVVSLGSDTKKLLVSNVSRKSVARLPVLDRFDQHYQASVHFSKQ